MVCSYSPVCHFILHLQGCSECRLGIYADYCDMYSNLCSTYPFMLQFTSVFIYKLWNTEFTPGSRLAVVISRVPVNWLGSMGKLQECETCMTRTLFPRGS
jgi:hypothetical protein